MKTTVHELQLVIKKMNILVRDDQNFKKLESANQKFKKLIETGLVKERGNNLMPIDEKHLSKLDYKVNF